MSKPTYKELLEKAKSRQIAPIGQDSFGLSKADISLLNKMAPELFISEFVKHLKMFYEKDKEFKVIFDLYKERGSEDTSRRLNKFIEELAPKIYNPETRTLLETQPSNVITRILKGLEKATEKAPVSVVPVPVKSTEPLTKGELKLFGFEEGVIDSKLSKELYHEALKGFIASATAKKMSDADKSNFIERFKNTYNAATGVKNEEDLLDPMELEYFKLGEKKLEKISEIKSNISQEATFEIAKSLSKKRLDPDVKKDLLIKLFNTVRFIKIRDNGSLNKFEEKWLDKKQIEDMVERVVRQKTRIEYLEGQPPMTQEERREFRRDDILKKRIKQDDLGRVLEISKGGLLLLTNLVDKLKRTNWKAELDKLTKGLKTVIPPIGEVEGSIDDIEDILRDLNVNSKDLPILLHVDENQYKPRIDDAALKTLLDAIRVATIALSVARKENKVDEIKKIADNLKNLESDKSRILRLRGMRLKGLKASVDKYLAYVKSKKEELAKYVDSTSEVRGSIKAISESIKELRNYFKDLMRQEEFMMRWNRPSSVTDKEKKETELLGEDFSTQEKTVSKEAYDKIAINLSRYEKAYSKFMGEADAVDSIKSSLESVIRTLALKMLSIVEMGPSRLPKIKELQEEFKTTSPSGIPGTSDKDKKREIVYDIEKIKMLPEKLGLEKDFFNNPYGGKGPSLKDMEDTIDELVRDLDKVDLEKQLDKVNEFFIDLENIPLWVKLSKPKDEDTMLHMASSLRTMAELILKKAAERRVAPSNVGTMYDIAFGRKKPTPSGITRRLPNFFIQDTSGLAKKVIEYLEKTGIPDMISHPNTDVSTQVEEAIKKTLKIPGKIEDFLANKERRGFETQLDLKKARQDLKRINSLFEGKKDAEGNVSELGLQDQFDTLRQKNIGQIEEALKFVLDPLDKLWESVEADRNKLPLISSVESGRTKALNELMDRVSGRPKLKSDSDILGEIEKFLNSNIDQFMAIKTKSTPTKVFLKEYNSTVKKDDSSQATDIPTDKQIDEDIQKAKVRDENNIEVIKNTLELFSSEHTNLLREFDNKNNTNLSETEGKQYTDNKQKKDMNDITTRFNTFIEAKGGIKEEDILDRYEKIFGKKYNSIPKKETIENDIKNFKASRILKLQELKNNFIERRKKLEATDTEKDFISEYNKKFNKKYKALPSTDEIRKDFKEYHTKEQGDVTGDKELIAKFNKLTGLQLDKLPSKEDIEAQVAKLTGKTIDFEDIIESKELALKALQTMPEAVERRVQRMPTDVTGERWYKDLMRDKSRHKTRWIENLLKDVEEPISNVGQYGQGFKRVKDTITTILNTKDMLIGKVNKIPVDRIKKQMADQIQQIDDLIKNKNVNAKVLPLTSFRISVIKPLNDILEAKDNINSMQIALEAHKSEYNKLKAFFDNEMLAKPEQKQDIGIEQEKALSGIRAYINFYDYSIKKSVNTIDNIIADVYPYAESFIKSISAALDSGAKDLNKDYMKIIDDRISDLKQLVSEVEGLIAGYKEALKDEKEYRTQKLDNVSKEAADDPYGEKLSPSETALKNAPGKEDLIIKDKPTFYKTIQKTINYLKKIIPSAEAISLEKNPGKGTEGANEKEYFDYFNNLSLDIPDYTAALKAEIIPGLRGLLKQEVRIPGLMNITTNLEDAVQTLEDLMISYTSARTKLKNRIDAEVKRHGISLTKIKELGEYFDPKTGDFIDFSDKEKEILKRVFMRQVYKYLDELWSQKQSQMHPTMGERSTDFYNNVWQSFKEYSGLRTNKKFISLLNTLKAETRADSSDDVKHIYLKSQQLEERKKELEKGLSDLGLDPKKNQEIVALDKSIAAIKEKEKLIDRVFNEMLKGAELQYISKIRKGLRDKAEVMEKDPEIEEFAPTAPIMKQKKEEDKVEIEEVVKDVNTLIDKIDEGLKVKGISNVEDAMDKLVNKANDSIKNLEAILKQGAWEIKSASYKNHSLFSPSMLYSRTMQATIAKLLKKELNI